MNITFNVSAYDIDTIIRFKVEQEINKLIDPIIKEKLKNLDFEELISKRINYFVDKSKYVSDNIIRNLVQQKIARELSENFMSNGK